MSRDDNEAHRRPNLDVPRTVGDRRAVERQGLVIAIDDRSYTPIRVELGDCTPAWLEQGDGPRLHSGQLQSGQLHSGQLHSGQWTIFDSASSKMSVAPSSFRAGINVLISPFGTTVSRA